MILHTTFMYFAETCAPRKRTFQPRLFSATVTVEVVEAPLEALPVAFRFDDPEAHPVPDMGHEVRWDGENLWEAYDTVIYGSLSGKARRDPRDAAWLQGLLDHRTVPRDGVGFDPLRLRIPGARSRDGTYPFMEDDMSVRHARASTLEARRAEVVAAARDLLVADGVLLRRTYEPLHDLKWCGPYQDRLRRVQVIQPSRTDGAEHGTWRADEAARMAAENRMEPGYEANLVQVLIPEACRAPLAESALATFGSMAASAMLSELGLAHADVSEVHAPLAREARSVMEAVKAGQAPDAAPLAGALAAARPFLDRLGEGRERLVRDVDVALRRYDDVGLASGFDFPAP